MQKAITDARNPLESLVGFLHASDATQKEGEMGDMGDYR
jgi:hypothetical protein